MSKSITASELRARIEGARSESKFFSRVNMKASGDTMRNYSASGPHAFTTICGEHCEVYALHRRRPTAKGLSAPAFFRAKDYSQTWGDFTHAPY